jgi:putative FmdB family regulatory protein
MTHLVPIYVYKCDNGHTFEAMQSMSEDPLDTCEVCGAPARRQLVAPAVHFKGSGFYTTDYARKGAAKSGGNGSGGGESKSESSSSKSDSSSSSGSSSGKAASSKD